MKITVVYYSATGHVRALAAAVAEGAAAAGAEVRLRAVDGPEPAELTDLDWADAYAFGTPSRFGTPAAPLKEFLDRTVELWRTGALADKPVTAFTAAHNRHGGHEATILALSHVFHHWGSLIVPPGFTDPAVYAAGGNPYGTSYESGRPGDGPDAAALAAAAYQGGRLARVTARLHGLGAAA